MDLTPRQLIGMFRAGAIEELLQSRTIWICASCYHCTLRCPAQIKITDLIYALKRIAIDEGICPSQPTGERMNDGGEVHLESGITPETIRQLMGKGHKIIGSRGGYGGYQGIWIDHNWSINC